MYQSVENYPLFQALQSGRSDLYQRAIQLRADVSKYLRNVSANFSHYTSHAVDHSDQIVRELSSLLYEEANRHKNPALVLNATEIYFLLLAIYLHDTGMVVTDQEKLEVLATDDWREFAAANADRADVLTLGDEAARVPDQDLFARGLEQQWALAEYFRSRHAERAAGAINGALHIASILDDDPAAERTLVAICVGHGLSRSELNSVQEYPTRRDHFGEPVNVRLLAVLLRVGDLLDMRFERACPLLRSSVSPLPASSEVHWDQYARITHRVTSPHEIRIEAECESANEHRLLMDWCAWIAAEVDSAYSAVAREPRQSGWVPPRADVGENGTLRIRRKAEAKYRVEDWKFHFDEAAVVSRLVKDVHGRGMGFLRELIQNALDASRARMYLENELTVSYPNEVEPEVREKYALKLTLTTRQTSEGGTVVAAVAIEDSGLGMTPEIIQNFFLQIGRSWYSSRAFLDRCNFTPTSRFGVGFLSVFAISDSVDVTTRWHLDAADRAISMHLVGPRGYLLIEDASRDHAGTTVAVEIKDDIALETMLSYVRHLCGAIEFPVTLTVDDEEIDLPSAIEEPSLEPTRLPTGVTFQPHRIDVSGEGVFGFVELLVKKSNGFEDWALSHSDLERRVLAADPMARLPELQPSCISINGLRAQDGGVRAPSMTRWVIDLRTAEAVAGRGLDRMSSREVPRAAVEKLERALDAHLAGQDASVGYTAALVRKFVDSCPQWADSVQCVELVSGRLASVTQLERMDSVLVPMKLQVYLGRAASREEDEKAVLDFTSARGLRDRCLRLSAVHRMGARQLERLYSGEWRRVLEVSPSLVLLEVAAPFGSGRRGYSRVERPVFDESSTLVLLRVDYRHVAINAAHPFIMKVDGLRGDHDVARDRMIKALTEYSTTSLDRLAELASGVAKAVGSRALRRYASKLKEPSLALRSMDGLRLPAYLVD